MSEQYSFGMIGLGTMGNNMVLNMSDHGYSVAGYDKNPAQVAELNRLDTHDNIEAFDDIKAFVASIKVPRTILLLVPAGHIVDAVIEELKPLLQKEDTIIDCGNSHFVDTQLRIDTLAKEGFHFMGLGVSGGETGARFGPSIMPGGDKTAYARISDMLAAVSAKVNGEPCTAYMGTGAAGHYVKMVHNGIEYALMQLISESYHLLKIHGGFTNEELNAVFTDWNKGKLQSFLIEITSAIFLQPDESGKGMLIDNILDTAHQKGTGAWMSQDAMKIQSPIPAIDAAVTQRILSSMKQDRVVAARFFAKDNYIEKAANKETLANDIENALYTAFIITYSQGLAMLQQASATYNYGIDVATVASIWRGGCIIRAAILKEITSAYQNNADLKNLMLSPEFSDTLKTGEPTLRRVIQKGLQYAIPLPSFSACLNYFDSYFSEWLPANLIQAQRDFFGAHTYERADKDGIFHTNWSQTIY